MASGLFTNTKRAGLPLAAVGPHFSSSYRACSWLSSTGVSRKAFWVRAVRNNWSSAASLSTWDM
ncbi:hypothetical protein D3C81_2161040 [compost metagenome]